MHAVVGPQVKLEVLCTVGVDFYLFITGFDTLHSFRSLYMVMINYYNVQCLRDYFGMRRSDSLSDDGISISTGGISISTESIEEDSQQSVGQEDSDREDGAVVNEFDVNTDIGIDQPFSQLKKKCTKKEAESSAKGNKKVVRRRTTVNENGDDISGITPASVHPGCRMCYIETHDYDKLPVQNWSGEPLAILKELYNREDGLYTIVNPQPKGKCLGQLTQHQLNLALECHIRTKHCFNSIMVCKSTFHIRGCSKIM